MKKFVIAILVLAFSFSAHAEVYATPGSVWNSVEMSPMDQGNLIDYFHVDQGIVVGHLQNWDVIPYVALNGAKNAANNEWNNQIEAEGGARLSRKFENGAIDLNAALGTERNFKYNTYYPKTDQTGLILSADGAYSWQKFKDSQSYDTPGYISAVVGTLSPLEGNNLIGVVRLEQAINLVKVKSTDVAAVYWGQVGADSAGYAWNNLMINGVGVRALYAFNGGVATLTGGIECANQSFGASGYVGGAVCGPTIRLDISEGWDNIRGTK